MLFLLVAVFSHQFVQISTLGENINNFLVWYFATFFFLLPLLLCPMIKVINLSRASHYESRLFDKFQFYQKYTPHSFLWFFPPPPPLPLPPTKCYLRPHRILSLNSLNNWIDPTMTTSTSIYTSPPTNTSGQKSIT